MEDTDARQLLTQFDDLNDDVDDLAFKLSASVGQESLGYTNIYNISLLISKDETLRDLFQNYLENALASGWSFQDVIHPMIQRLFLGVAFEHLFQNFSPTLDEDSNAVVQMLYNKIIAKRGSWLQCWFKLKFPRSPKPQGALEIDDL